MNTQATLITERGPSKLVNATNLLEILFDEDSRPSLRSLRTWTSTRIIPSVRIGRLIFYDLAAVQAALSKRTSKTR
jgi:hypothetical protein